MMGREWGGDPAGEMKSAAKGIGWLPVGATRRVLLKFVMNRKGKSISGVNNNLIGRLARSLEPDG
jgi:hypothetical protein